ncbi:nucleotide disphospho-sugar-binding domain-containing protein [Lentzea flava]|uniref:nucleotide disphospho-sugar-binding domain-containing protein n=1 Tax=Lentzea flava TaxID=103732 RepID=UPI001E2D672C|nr:nucleotide disphospho-sugar-binding domain-containing protein [Lentzea flava]
MEGFKADLVVAQLCDYVGPLVAHERCAAGGAAAGADQFFQAERVAAAGAGIALDPPAQAPEALVAAVRSVLEDVSFRENVSAIAKEIAAMPDADEVVLMLEAGP